jgi:hypothetical protein
MTRRTKAGGGLLLMLALLLSASASEAQRGRDWNRSAPPPYSAQGGPSIRNAPQLPNYYLERQGPVAAPKAPATGPSGEKVQLVIGPNGEIVGVRVLGQGAR